MTPKQIENQQNSFKNLINCEVTTQEFKTALSVSYDITLEKAKKYLVNNPNHNKTALNRIVTEMQRRSKNPNRYSDNIKKKYKNNKHKEELYMNQVNLIGNLTRDPELTETSTGVKVCRFSIAVNRNYKSSDGERKTDYLDCVAWRGLAETVAKYTKKGNKVRVTGPIETRTYEDSQGMKRSAFHIIVQDVEFLTAKTSAEDEAASNKLQPINDDDSDIPF